MWGDPDPDPGGGAPEPHTSREIIDLKDQNEQQQVLIAQLKEMLRKEQSTVPQEKVEEYINTLSKAKAKKSRLKKSDSSSTEKSSSMESRKNEKVNLLKQQLEENKVKLAERGMRQKDLEDMVTVIKAQLNDSQQFINATPTNLVSLEKNLDYNKNTSPEELYNILLVKEKRISDLLEKSQKQEASILDLQENLKEKDSVIDARTKAITLMTENLSKKGKDTLDALDETKEQMRKMQENFITLESEMKARQMVLLNDLKSKNIEIADLQEEKEKLIEENNELLKHGKGEKPESDNHELIIKDLKHKLDESRNANSEKEHALNEFAEKIKDLEKEVQEKTGSSQPQNTEIEKLKKQLDESNKTMIKVKAQNKSKIKELNKKLDTFKKMSDANAMIIQLQTEITGLNEKIAELEEEKGNMQLKMVESIESIKGSTHSDDVKELQEKLDHNLEELDEKDKVISLLESDIISLKSEIHSLTDKNSRLSQIQNEQVTSEIKSIQIEEQMESLQSKNEELQSEIEILKKEKDELLEKIDEFSKEKLELTTKLDNYIQENMELIDKLEKLSAEKVSSAESIEIVESLTQQEKLELAAYQKNMETNLEDNIKTSDEEPPVELNESVLQLTEETAELLKKIEMFNMERKEVMNKLDSLREENNQLGLKLNEVENNRDILAETYEQVQTEKDELQKEKEELIQKLKDLQSDQQVIQEQNVDEDVHLKLQKLQQDYEKILQENENLRKSVKELNTKIHEKDNLDVELTKYEEKINQLESQIKENIEEINNYQTIIEENKTELINSSNIINQLQSQLTERENDITDLNNLINDLNDVVDNLQNTNSKLDDFEVLEKQLEELKSSLNHQVELAQIQAEEFKEELAFNKVQNEQEIEKKNRELDRLTQEVVFKEETIENLKQQLKEKDASVSATIEEMKQKYLTLQKQLNSNSGSLETQVDALSSKNKEQLEKMKKIAASLKKKTQAYQELEDKFKEEKEKWETEVNKKETDTKNIVSELVKEIEDLKEELNSKSVLLEQSEVRINELSNIISNLESQNIDLQNLVLELRQKHEKISEVNLKQELSRSLHEEFDNLHDNTESTNEDKLKELQLIVETNEVELNHYRERSQKLEEDLAGLLEEKETLLVRTMELEERLNLLSKNVEEKSLLEEEMDHKLQEVAANDEVLTKRIEQLISENKELTDKTRDQEELITKLKLKIKRVQEKISQTKNLQSSLEEQEHTNIQLRQQIAQLETLHKQSQLDYEEKQKQNQSDYERIESDYQLQLEELLRSRGELTFECEKLQEEIKCLTEKEDELILELKENRQKLMDRENHYNNQIATLTDNLNETTSNWQSCTETIQTLHMEMETLRTQMLTDAAKRTVDDVISVAKEKILNTKDTQTESNDFIQPVRQSEPVATENFFQQDFHTWGHEHQPSNNWFSERDPLSSGSQDSGLRVTKEDMENKIKALEVLLYNVDQEKEEVIRECSDMLGELTRLVYEKVQNYQPVDPVEPFSNLESQIMSLEEIDAQSDPHKLQQVEFGKTSPSLGQQIQPVMEQVGPPSTAYLTYPSDQPKGELESQIMSSTDINLLNDPEKLQQLEFERTDPLLRQQNHPVIERLSQPSKAYVTYQIGEAIGENDDGWGWGPEEARLEEEHQYRTENTPQVQSLRMEIEALQQRVQLLQNEREQHLEEIKQFQIKSGKLVKKCKELKLKNDQLASKAKSDTSDFFDLDQTIQDELKTQIEQLETKIKEIGSELEKEKQEKCNLLKRVDVLMYANDKMLEMKEIQDSEIYRWKRKYEEIQERLDHLDWGSDESKSPKKQTTANSEAVSEDIEELKKLVQDLTVDNEELQALLNDQKQQRVQFERSKSVGNEERIKHLEEDILNKEKLIKELIGDKDKVIQDIQGKLEEKHTIVQNLQEKLNFLENIENQNKELQVILDEKNTVHKGLEEDLKQCQYDLVNNIKELEKHSDTVKELEDALNHYKNTNEELQAFLKEKQSELETNIQLEELKQLLMKKTALADQFQTSNDSLNQEISTLRKESEHLKQEFNNLQANTNQIITALQNQLQYQQADQGIDVVNPAIQEFTQLRANSLKELLELFNEEQNNFESLKLNYQEITNVTKTYEVQIKELEQELLNQKQHYQELQTLSSKNILELQTELEEQKQRNDQLEVENVSKLQDISLQLDAERRKYSELQFDLQLTSEKADSQVVQQLNNLLGEKETNIQELKKTIKELEDAKGELEGETKNLKDELNRKQVELDRIVIEMEDKLVDTISNLEEKWAAQVDERGNTVAESWKCHLAIVESDFEVIQMKLKTEINELEEKCNALVNENNELRKNVDTEIKNEVDRISALQQQINDRQHVINELKQILVTEQKEKATLALQMGEVDKLQQLLADKEVELASLKTLAETTRQQFDEKREVVEEVVKILERNSSFPLSCEKQDILNEIQSQLGLATDKQKEVENINAELNSVNAQLQNLSVQLQNYSIAIQDRDAEILKLKEIYEAQLSQKIEEIESLKESNKNFNNQTQNLTQKEVEIKRLEEVVGECKIQAATAQEELQKVQQLHMASVGTIEDYQVKLEEFYQTHISLQRSLEEKDQHITTLQNQIEEFQQVNISLQNSLEEKNQQVTSLSNEIETLHQQIHTLNQDTQHSSNLKETEKLETELAHSKESFATLQQSLADCQQQLFNITQDLATKTHEFETVSHQLAYSQQNADILQGEINQLNETLHLKEQEYAVSIENIQKAHFKELESHYEELLSAKDLDIQTLRSQIAESVYNISEHMRLRSELENRIKQYEVQLTELLNTKSELGAKILEQETKMLEHNTLTEEENNQLTEMRGIIEEQVVKIEELKKELFEKSNDYDSLIAEMDISRNAITQQPMASGSRSETASVVAERPPVPDDDLSEPVNRAELDLALYMLHQRDVRCEELTVELTHLLEERDTLQLRLSNAIREKEEMRRKVTGVTGTDIPTPSTTETIPGTPKSSRTSEIFLAASGTELASEPLENLIVQQDLASKLSELRTVGYKKDKTFVDEQQQRRLQQISIMQQHIREAAKLPPEAAAKLVDASYTLSRDVQSPSKVLLNWLWGRSTPRVNDT